MKLFDSEGGNVCTKQCGKLGSRFLIIVPVVIVLILTYAVDYFFNSEITMDIYTEYVVFRGGLSGEPIYYDEITSLVLLEEGFELGQRVSGYSTLSYHAGTFQGGSLEEAYDVYLQRDWQGPVLIFNHDGGTLVLGSASFDMKQLYSHFQKKP